MKITPNQSKNTAGIASNLSEDNDPALSINDWAPPKSNAPDRSPILRSRTVSYTHLRAHETV